MTEASSSSLAPSAQTLSGRVLRVFSMVIGMMTSVVIILIYEAIDDTLLAARGTQSVQDADSFSRLIVADIKLELANLAAHAVTIPALDLTASPDALERTLTNLKESLSKYAWIGFIDPAGRVLAASDGWLVGRNVAHRVWFKEGLAAPAVTDVHPSPALAKLFALEPNDPPHFLDVATPVIDANGRLLGTLAADIRLDWFAERFAFYVGGRLTQSAILPSVMGPEGNARFGHHVSERLANKIIGQRADRGWLLESGDDGGRAMISYARHRALPEPVDLGWTTVIQMPMAILDADTLSTRSLAVAAVLTVSVVAWLTFWWLLTLWGEPIRLLMSRIQAARVHHKEIPDLNNLPEEFRHISRAINDLIDSIQARERALQSTLDDLRESFTGVTRTFPGVLFRAQRSPSGESVFTYLSASAEHYFGVRVGPLPMPTKQLYRNIESSARNMLEARLRGQARFGDLIDVTVPAKGMDLTLRHLRLLARQRTTSDGHTAWDGVIVDVSELIEARQQATAADLAKSRFLAAMSHELRTPLNGLLGYAQLLSDEITDPAQRADVMKITETAEMLATILNDVLDFSKIEEGKLLIDNKTFNPFDLVDNCASLFTNSAREREVRLSIIRNFPSDLWLVGDPVRLRQILINLLSNAIKFTDFGSVQLRSDIAAATGHAVRLRITVEDTGIGMGPGQISKLFRPFEQTDISVYRRFGGSGLGLAIVKGLLDAMSGTIEVQSEKGKGSTFVVEVPLALAASKGESQFNDYNLTTDLNILLVDDVPLNRELLRRMLQRWGHRVVEAVDGQDALNKAAVASFDLILMDIDMPGMDGLEATRRLRATKGPCQFARIVALTGYAFASDIANALASGMNGHLAKPVTIRDLRSLLRADANA